MPQRRKRSAGRFSEWWNLHLERGDGEGVLLPRVLVRCDRVGMSRGILLPGGSHDAEAVYYRPMPRGVLLPLRQQRSAGRFSERRGVHLERGDGEGVLLPRALVQCGGVAVSRRFVLPGGPHDPNKGNRRHLSGGLLLPLRQQRSAGRFSERWKLYHVGVLLPRGIVCPGDVPHGLVLSCECHDRPARQLICVRLRDILPAGNGCGIGVRGRELLRDAVDAGGVLAGELLPGGVHGGDGVCRGKLLCDPCDAGELHAGRVLPGGIDCEHRVRRWELLRDGLDPGGVLGRELLPDGVDDG